MFSTDIMTPTSFIVTKKDGSVAILELNRPEKRNALSQALINELIEGLSGLARDASVRAVVLTGSGEGPFCGMSSGLDPELVKINLCLQLERISVS